MSNMNIIGEIPDTMSQLSQLRLLDLSSNRLNGTIPIWVWRLRNLEMLYLNDNSLCGQITGPIEAMNLTKINIAKNQIKGQIPKDFGKLKKLTLLLLHDNHLSGLIPKGIALLPMLRVMKLSRNFLYGGLPHKMGKHSMLFKIEMSSNNLSGKLPEGLCSFQTLRYIDFSHNSLSGEFPGSIFNCSSLRSIFLYNNQFRGSFPAGVWSLPELTKIIIKENGFSGLLPSKIGSNITTINISNNRFSGSLPMLADKLNTLIAENNFISGEIPTNLILHAPLQVLHLAENMLSGSLPSMIWHMHCLMDLDLRKNNLSGEIPDTIGDFMPINENNTIDLSENNLSGPIPLSLIQLRPTFLNLSSNQLTGQIPSSFEIKRYERSFLSNPGLCSSDHFVNLPMCIRQPQGPEPEKQHKHLRRLIIIFLVLGSIIIIITGIFCFSKVNAFLTRQKQDNPAPFARWKLTTFHPTNYSVEDILCGLTNNNLVGSGGSGKVYKMCLRNSNCKIAVKKICIGLRKDAMLEKQFQAEIETLGYIRHANIVKLLGCISSSESKLLIYEYMDHGSLYDWLHQRDATSTTELLNWPIRMSIAIDTARGLSYMHHDCSPPIAHRDV
ncbi:hypothetical protein HU200_064848 [Digitaria exilis]|uniref:Protein kinase domain-containing protein n=1 Tax=Digitaria exilis TaxID=1010633 RepID=A0A835A0S0_9POAL|nr:hypothetical protein HU200_064848 [Digitaria exilis]